MNFYLKTVTYSISVLIEEKAINTGNGYHYAKMICGYEELIRLCPQ